MSWVARAEMVWDGGKLNDLPNLDRQREEDARWQKKITRMCPMDRHKVANSRSYHYVLFFLRGPHEQKITDNTALTPVILSGPFMPFIHKLPINSSDIKKKCHRLRSSKIALAAEDDSSDQKDDRFKLEWWYFLLIKRNTCDRCEIHVSGFSSQVSRETGFSGWMGWGGRALHMDTDKSHGISPVWKEGQTLASNMEWIISELHSQQLPITHLWNDVGGRGGAKNRRLGPGRRFRRRRAEQKPSAPFCGDPKPGGTRCSQINTHSSPCNINKYLIKPGS